MTIRGRSKAQIVRLRVTANRESTYTLMIEPWGMTYQLSGTDHMFVDLEVSGDGHPELVAWPGGLSIFAYGPAVTRSADGTVLHEF